MIDAARQRAAACSSSATATASMRRSCARTALVAQRRLRRGAHDPRAVLHRLHVPRRGGPRNCARDEGGGVLFSQAAHQVDIVRLLGGGEVSTRARAAPATGTRRGPPKGAYSALLTFAGRRIRASPPTAATRTSTATNSWAASARWATARSGRGVRRSPAAACTSAPRAARRGGAEGRAQLRRRALRRAGRCAAAGAGSPALRPSCSCAASTATCAPLPDGVTIYADDARRFEPVPPPAVPRAEVIDELWARWCDGPPPLHCGEWATRDARSVPGAARFGARRPRVALAQQVGVPAMTRPPHARRTRSAMLRHWREAVPDDRLAHLVRDAARVLSARAADAPARARRVASATGRSCACCGSTTASRRASSVAQAGVMEPTTFAAVKAMEARGYVVRRQLPGNRKNVLRVPDARRARAAHASWCRWPSR